MIVLLHGFMDSPRTWDLVRPHLRDDVLAPALPGHLGGPPAAVGMLDHLDGLIDAPAHLVGTSLGGYLALALAARGKALSVVALAPAGGTDHSETLVMQERGVLLSEFAARPIPPDAAAHLAAAMRACDAAPLLARARKDGWPLDLARVACPVRIVWGLEDRLLPYPQSVGRYRQLNAEWVELDGVGHAPQLEIPLETAQLISFG